MRGGLVGDTPQPLGAYARQLLVFRGTRPYGIALLCLGAIVLIMGLVWVQKPSESFTPDLQPNTAVERGPVAMPESVP